MPNYDNLNRTQPHNPLPSSCFKNVNDKEIENEPKWGHALLKIIIGPGITFVLLAISDAFINNKIFAGRGGSPRNLTGIGGCLTDRNL